jgi:hypothetical protein
LNESLPNIHGEVDSYKGKVGKNEERGQARLPHPELIDVECKSYLIVIRGRTTERVGSLGVRKAALPPLRLVKDYGS